MFSYSRQHVLIVWSVVSIHVHAESQRPPHFPVQGQLLRREVTSYTNHKGASAGTDDANTLTAVGTREDTNTTRRGQYADLLAQKKIFRVDELTEEYAANGEDRELAAAPGQEPSDSVDDYSTLAVMLTSGVDPDCYKTVGNDCSQQWDDRFRKRLYPARTTWGRRAKYFVVVTGTTGWHLGKHCTHIQNLSSQASALDNHIAEFHCTGAGIEPFVALVTDCSDHYEERDGSCCKVDRYVEYAFFLTGQNYNGVQWYAYGDDDMGFSFPPLFDFLRHYKYHEKIVLNPAAETLAQQRKVGDPSWNKVVRTCNAVVPERFMGSVYSRALMQSLVYPHANRALQHVCKAFDNGALDTILGLFMWAAGAKFLPLGQSMPDERDPTKMVQTGSQHDLYIAHRIRTNESNVALDAEVALRYPEPEELVGNKYSDSVNARAGGTLLTLTPANCVPS